MESLTGDTEGSSEDLKGASVSEKKRFRLKSLRTRLFGKKGKEKDGQGKLSHSASASDIPKGEDLGSDEDLACSQGALGSRALSHDSIFQGDQNLSGPETPRVLSQENVSGKIKALQDKLQQQNMRLGPPPLVLPIKRQDDLGGSSEDDGLTHSPPECYLGDAPPRKASYKASSQPSSRPLSPTVKPPPSCSMPPTPSLQPAPLAALSGSTADFSSPAQFTPCLDSSAARHRMSVKPRNQRASAKSRRLTENESRPRSESLNHIARPPPMKNEGEITKEMMRSRSHSTHVLGAGVGVTSTTSVARPEPPLKNPETPLQSALPRAQEALTSSNPASILPVIPDSSPLSPRAAVAKPPKPVEQPQPSSVMPKAELRTRGGVGQGKATGPLVGQENPEPTDTESMGATQRRVSRGSFKSSVISATTDQGRPRKGSFQAVVEQAAAQEGVYQGKATGSPGGQEDAGQTEAESMGATQRRVSGSFKSSVISATMDQGRPRSGSFLAVVEQAGAQAAGPPVGQEDPESTDAESMGATQRRVSGSFKSSVISATMDQGRPRSGSFLAVVEQAGAKGVGPPVGQEDPESTDAESLGATQRRVSGSFKSSVISATMDQGRPRSGSFLAVVEQAGAKAAGSPVDQEDPEPTDAESMGATQRRVSGGSFKSSVISATMDQGRPRKGSFQAVVEQAGAELRKEEREGRVEAKVSKDTGTPEGVEEAMEAKEVKEENAKTAFGVKLRTTSLSLKYRSEVAATGQSDPKIKRHSAETSIMTPPLAPFDPASRAPGADQRGIKANLSLKKPPSGISDTAATLSAQAASDARIAAQSIPSSLKDIQPTPSATNNASAPPVKAPATSSAPRASPLLQPAPQAPKAAPPPAAQPPPQAEVSWMSMAMEKTRSFQQLITSRLPMEFPGMQQAAPRPQTEPQAQPKTDPQPQPQKQVNSQVETQTAAQSQTQTASPFQTATQPPVEKFLTTSQPQPDKQPQTQSMIQQSQTQAPTTTTQTRKATTTQTTGQTYTGKQSQTQNIPQITNQANPRLVQPTATQAPPAQFTHSYVNQQSNLRSTQSPLLRSLPQTRGETPPQASSSSCLSSSPKSSPSQPPRSSQGLLSNPQPKPTTQAQVSTSPAAPASVLAPAAAPTAAPAPASRDDKSSSFQRRGDATARPEGRVSRPGMVEERASAFQEKQTEWTTSTGSKVELRKTPFETPVTESTVPAKTTLTRSLQERPESSPTKIPGRLVDREDKWLRMSMQTSSSPSSSSPTSSSPLQNISNSGQPSWMELAKRKSMAWGDKTMD